MIIHQLLLKSLKCENNWARSSSSCGGGYPEELDRRAGLVVCTRVDEPTDLQGGDEVRLKAEHEICGFC